ncbi:hypothetical protein [Methylobacterium soli]|uniref:DNA-binding protein n=1 Tax=Methylobacterium soli TaxID=553447 RepID=A0A6L3T0B6_9HYPH|nr:hypothetical protein [Methylobacterium soli]KAB1079365.1 hypothetical protein F6X53_11195 [Methylobacterium soli]GJE44179.1 hypothetical protein AEGHOMDF_3365 [Methylobacterium soli]
MTMHTVWPRLMTPATAARYCDMSLSAFERSCPVTPISLSNEERLDRRMLRYDREALNAWIDALSGRPGEGAEPENWAAKVFG